MSRMRRFQRIIRVCTAERLCTLVVIGADEDGRKHLLAVEDGARESKQELAGSAAACAGARDERT